MYALCVAQKKRTGRIGWCDSFCGANNMSLEASCLHEATPSQPKSDSIEKRFDRSGSSKPGVSGVSYRPVVEIRCTLQLESSLNEPTGIGLSPVSKIVTFQCLRPSGNQPVRITVAWYSDGA